jgi:hypothetical protein
MGMETFGCSVVFDIVFNRLGSVLGREVFHLILVKKVLVDLVSDESLIFVLQILHQPILFVNVNLALWVSVVILLFSDKMDTHFVDLGLFFVGLLGGGEVVFHRGIILTPGQDLSHAGILVSQVLLLSKKTIVVLQLVEVAVQILVGYFSTPDVWFADVVRLDLFVAFSIQNISHLLGLLASLCQLLTGSGGVMRRFWTSFHLSNLKKFKFKNNTKI